MDDEGVSARIADVAAFLREYNGYHGHVRRALTLLTGAGAEPLEAVVGASGLSRASVEQVLRIVEPDLDSSADGYRLVPAVVETYRRELGLPDPSPPPADDLVAEMGEIVDAAPSARRDLDHVAATPATAVDRGRWLHDRYDLSTHRVLFVGDHDLTSVATGLVDDRLSADVVDIDEDVLEYVDTQARRRSLDIRTYYADLRVGLPPELLGQADIAFSDPPYTPEGMSLFALRAAAGLRPSDFSELVLSYGFGERQPMLGHKVQQALLGAGFVIRAMLPGVNRYRGAQAIGSRSDLYVLAATSRTWKLAGRDHDDPDNIYTHGRQSLEARGRGVPDEVLAAAPTPQAYVGDGTPARTGLPSAHVPTVLRGGVPRSFAAAESVLVDLSADTGPTLLRMLLAVNSARVTLVVDAGHPVVTDDRQFQAVADLVHAKYSVRRESVHDGKGFAFVHAERRPPAGTDQVWAAVLTRSHGSWATAWREALIAGSRQRLEAPLTKRDARGIVSEGHGDRHWAGRLIDLPRHQIRQLAESVAESVRRPEMTGSAGASGSGR